MDTGTRARLHHRSSAKIGSQLSIHRNGIGGNGVGEIESPQAALVMASPQRMPRFINDFATHIPRPPLNQFIELFWFHEGFTPDHFLSGFCRMAKWN